MGTKKKTADQASDLRRRAEKMATREDLSKAESSQAGMSSAELQHLVHELRVHQIELEIQNEELRRAHFELEILKDRYVDLYDFAPVGYVTLGIDGRITEANLEICRLLGVERSRLIRQPLSRFVLEEERDLLYLHLKRAQELGERVVCEIRMTKKNGEEFAASLQSRCTLDEAGEAIGCRCIVQDISERRRAELERLRHIQTLGSLVHAGAGIQRSESIREVLELVADTARRATQSAHTLAGCRNRDGRFSMVAATESSQVLPCTELSEPGEEQFGGCLDLLKDREVTRLDGGEIRAHAGRLVHPVACPPIEDLLGARLTARDGEPSGFIMVFQRLEGSYDAEDELLMGQMATLASLGLQHQQLLDDLVAARDNLEQRVEERTAELTRSESRLRESNLLLQQVVNGITEPLVMLSDGMRVRLLNKAAEDYYGVRDVESVLGRPCHEALMGEKAACTECGYAEWLRSDRPVSFERRGLMDPERFEMVKIYPLFGETDRKTGWIIRVSDISQRKCMEKELIQNEKLTSLGLMTSGIAHEINNPNSFIAFNLPILRDYLDALLPIVDAYAEQHPDLELCRMTYPWLRQDMLKLLDNMEHGSRRIHTIVNNLRRFIRKGDRPEWQKVDLAALVERTTVMCRPELKRLKTFEITIAEDIPPLVTDPDALQQILLNLLINAVHACEETDGRVHLGAATWGPGRSRIAIQISDNGTGIEDGLLAKIFDPFFTTKPPSSGTGLGLYVCHTLVEALGGKIQVETSPGRGSTFRVILDVDGPKSGTTAEG